MGKIELREYEGGFALHLTLDAGRAGEVEFMNTYPTAMTRREAEARLFRLSELFGFEREDFPVSNLIKKKTS